MPSSMQSRGTSICIMILIISLYFRSVCIQSLVYLVIWYVKISFSILYRIQMISQGLQNDKKKAEGKYKANIFTPELSWLTGVTTSFILTRRFSRLRLKMGRRWRTVNSNEGWGKDEAVWERWGGNHKARDRPSSFSGNFPFCNIHELDNGAEASQSCAFRCVHIIFVLLCISLSSYCSLWLCDFPDSFSVYVCV